MDRRTAFLDKLQALRARDPRIFQIVFLATLLAFVLAFRDFAMDGARMVAILAAALGTQALLVRLYRLPPPGPYSPLITGLSLCLLLRTNSLEVAALAAALGIASKFVLRFGGKHLFNPSAFGLVVVLLATDDAWVSAGQWGSGALLAFGLLALGLMIVGKVGRLDITVAFLAAHLGLKLARVLWLGHEPAVFLHQAANGSLILFAFFMISDPRSTPDARGGRVLFATLVAVIAHYLQFHLFWNQAPIWALLFVSPVTPFLDRVWRHARFQWRDRGESMQLVPTNPVLMRSVSGGAARTLLLILCVLAGGNAASAFCGFYVARADASLYNEASQVILARDGDRTVITMANDYQGDLTEFAMVVPVPSILREGQIRVGDRRILERLDAFSAPRLVEYFDGDPCRMQLYRSEDALKSTAAAPMGSMEQERDSSLGVTVEAAYTVGEYDIVILSAEESDGLETWLRRNGYRLPRGASRALAPYIRQDLKFFVAKVNLEEQAKTGFSYLRPLQMAFESPRFMLPIRLGMLNAKGEQDLIVYVLTRGGRVETTTYRTVKIPSGQEIPPYVKEEFADTYRAMFETAHAREGRNAVFLEYFWDMGWCDPCAANPLSPAELRQAGVFWLREGADARGKAGAQEVRITRLHVRYDAAHFPEDLMFQETADRQNFQARYVLRHPFQGATCGAADGYYRAVAERQEREAQTLANLTGWEIADIRRRAGIDGTRVASDPWWKRIFD